MRYIVSFLLNAFLAVRWTLLAFGDSIWLSWLFKGGILLDGLVETLTLVCVALSIMRGVDNVAWGWSLMSVCGQYCSVLTLQGVGASGSNQTSESSSSSELFAQDYLLAARMGDLKSRGWRRVLSGVAQLCLGHGLLLEWTCDNMVHPPPWLAFAAALMVFASVSSYTLVLWGILTRDLALLSHKKAAFSAVSQHLASFEGRPEGALSWFQMDSDFVASSSSPSEAGDETVYTKSPEFSFFDALAFVVDVPIRGLEVLHDQPNQHPPGTLKPFQRRLLDSSLRTMAVDMHRVEIALLNPLPHLSKMMWQQRYRTSCDELVASLHNNGIAWVLRVVALVSYLPTVLHRALSCGTPLYLVALVTTDHSDDGAEVIEGGGAGWSAGQALGCRIFHATLAIELMLWIALLCKAYLRRSPRRTPAPGKVMGRDALDTADAHFFLEPYVSGEEMLELISAREAKKYI